MRFRRKPFEWDWTYDYLTAPPPRRFSWRRPTFTLRLFLILIAVIGCAAAIYSPFESEQHRFNRVVEQARALQIQVITSDHELCVISVFVNSPTAAQLKILPELPGLESVSFKYFASPATSAWDNLQNCTKLRKITSSNSIDAAGLMRIAQHRPPALERIEVWNRLEHDLCDALRDTGLPLYAPYEIVEGKN